MVDLFLNISDYILVLSIQNGFVIVFVINPARPDEIEYKLIEFSWNPKSFFILFLIVKLNTYDGIPNSVNNLRKSKSIHPKLPLRLIRQRIFFNFFIMKVRMKISY